MKVAIVDDQVEFLFIFTKVLKEKKNYAISTFDDPFIFLNHANSFDLVFLDIEMPAINGIELCHRLANLNLSIIFITSHHEMMQAAFNKNVIGFIDKANYKDQLPAILTKIEAIQHLPFIEPKDKIKIYFHEIIYITYQYQDVTLHLTNNREFSLKEHSLKKILEQLDERFITINRNNAINLDFPFITHKDQLQLNNLSFTISRRNLSKVKDSLLERSFKHVI